uniref:Uncharacterized protein n=1 Tax=Ciona savignyi TaxID=51511 RepID=H2YJH9_CIOSA
MPVKFGDDDYRRHNNDDYSFTTRSDSSRDYAMRRRWGDFDEEPMSQISSPLRFPKIGQSNRRSYSPYELPEDLAMPRRRQVRSNERFDEDDDVMDDVISSVKPRRNKFNEYLLDSDEEDEIVLPPRLRYRASPSRFYEEEEEEEKVSPRSKPAAKDVEKRRRAQFEKKAKRGYTMPVSIRRPDPAVGEEEEAIKDIASYIAVRSSYPVEEEDDIQEVPHQKYQYRTRGPQQLMTSHYDDALEKSRDRLNRAPMFDMKLRSHVVWEKMYVKFTCTLRGS